MSGTRDGSITIWDVDSGEQLRTLPKLELPVEGLAFSPDGKLLASTSGDYKQHTKPGTVKLWSTDSWDEVANLSGPTQKMRPVQFSPDGNTLLAGGSQSELLVYNVPERKLSKRISFGMEVSAFTFLPNSQYALLGGYDGRVELWDLQSGIRSVRYEGHRPVTGNHNFLFHMASSIDGSVLASASGDGHVKLWPATNLAPIKPLMTLENPNTDVFSVAISPDGTRYAISKTDKTVQIIETKTGKVLKTIENLNTPCSGLSFAPDGRSVAGGMLGGKVFIWDAGTGEELLAIEGHEGGTRRVAFSPDGQSLATGGWDETAAVWSTVDGSLRYRTSKQGLAVSDVKFSPEGKLLIFSTGSHRDWKKPGTIKIL
ncbi:MAG: WD40 repeat domain-containing protein, partial [Planctomycetaceae bacterium]|nr:WD40 repeat domain-containing protein [Planctomycetaceae bacterium]